MLTDDWLVRLSLAVAAIRMWKFQRKMRNSTLTGGEHLSVICVTQGGGRSTFQHTVQRVGTRSKKELALDLKKSREEKTALTKTTVLRFSPDEWTCSLKLTETKSEDFLGGGPPRTPVSY